MPKHIFSTLSILALLLYPLSLSAQNTSPSPDFNGNGKVDIADFLEFVEVYGSNRGDGTYQAKYDLDPNGVIDISDFLIFVENFGKSVPPSGGDSTPDAAFARFNEQRQKLGLSTFKRFVEGDDTFISVEEFLVGCEASVEDHEELTREDLDGISLSVSTGGSECGLKVVTYHIVPEDQKMRVERSIWECFSESRDMREGNDVSCGGRYTFLGRHVKWHPKEVFYTIEAGENLRDKFRSYIPWIEDKLKVKVSEAASSQAANLFLHLGVESLDKCSGRYGCNIFEEVEDRQFATIYISASAPDVYFSQVLKHELLHAILPMGHLPEGNYLMSVRPVDPSQTHTLTPKEEKLLKLYTNPYLRADMTMEKFRQYLIIE